MRTRAPRPGAPGGTRRRRSAAGLVALAVALTPALALAGCGDDGDDGTGADVTTTSTSASGAPAAEGAATVEASDFAFDPQEVRVRVGEAVTWSNRDEAHHTVSADDGSFSLDLDGAGTSGSVTFDEPGSHDYHCDVHPSMTGTVVVG